MANSLTKIDDRGLKTPIDLLDNEKIRFGTGNDIEIYHDGTHSKIHNNTNFLVIETNQFAVNNHAADEAIIKGFNGGAVELYYDNSKKFETSSTGGILSGTLWTALDNTKIAFGTQDDLQIYHDSSNSYLANTTGNLIIKDTTGTIYLQSTRIDFESEDGEQIAHFISDGAVELYYDNSKVFETNSNGIRIFGTEGNAGQLQIYADEGDDNADKWIIEATTSGGLEIKNLAAGSWEKNIACNGNGNVELYYDNSKKFETLSDGIYILGNSWQNDNHKGLYGDAGDLQIYHDGSNSYVTNTTGDLYLITTGDDVIIRSTDDIKLQPKDGESGIQVHADGGVDLYYDNVKRFETTSAGAIVTGQLSADNLILGDGEKLYCGDGDDLQIYHSSSENWIKANSGVTNFLLDSWVQFKNKADDENLFRAQPNGPFEAYYDNSKKLETTSGGVTVTGNISATSNLLLADNVRARFGTGEDLQIYHDGNNSYVEDSGTGSLILRTGRVSFNDASNNEMGRFDSDGLKFNGDSAAANALDDYEEGTWTVQLKYHSGGSWHNVSYDSNPDNTTGYYTKIGNMVRVTIHMGAFDLDNGPGSLAQIAGLPFTTSNGSYDLSVGVLTHSNCFGDPTNTAYTQGGEAAFRPTQNGSTSSSSWANGTKYLMHLQNGLHR